ncbi:MAG: WecB/TagA/CpsF family glycosyltransferase, partial [Patescibacteria group bacterium]
MPDILGLSISDLSCDEAVNQISNLLNKPGKHLVLTANPEILVSSFFNKDLYQLFKKADLILADGFGLILAATYLGTPIKKGRVTGVELLKRICQKSYDLGFKIFLTGADENILDFATQRIKEKYNNVNIVGYKKGPIFSINN